ncbi:uncharacterized protein RJT21DRAFT_77 [Scheffersomyces amazonensis]|uniref:uncharacterized protein n=1 Tax=Scheffersomyces amazonensis TaxID=1078765 RepID=UPI00315CBB03
MADSTTSITNFREQCFPFAYPTFYCGEVWGIFPNLDEEDLGKIYICGMSAGYVGDYQTCSQTSYPNMSNYVTFPIDHPYPIFGCGTETSTYTNLTKEEAMDIYSCGITQGKFLLKQKKSNANQGRLSWTLSAIVIVFMCILIQL